MFKKIYIEITNSCNFSCDFCVKTIRRPIFMDLCDYEKIMAQISDRAFEFALHVLGEPLLHPNFIDILNLSPEGKINLTTNSSLIDRVDLNHKAIRQINFSIHALPLDKLQQVFLYVEKLNPNIYVNYRLWRQNRDRYLDEIEKFYSISINRNVDVAWKKSKKIRDKIYLNFDSEFKWPNISDPPISEVGKCYALSEQIAILSDGRVVPCCLDYDGNMTLGNIKDTSLDEILNTKRALDIKYGFQNKKRVEKLCQRCSFINRFTKY